MSSVGAIEKLAQKKQAAAYQKLIDSLVKKIESTGDESGQDKWGADVDELKKVLQSVVAAGDSGGMVVAKPTVKHYAKAVLELSNNDALTAVCKFSLDLIKPKDMYYAEQVIGLSHGLAECQQAEGEYSDAAKTLGCIDLETPQMKQLSVNIRAGLFIQTATLFLQDDNTTNASSYVNKAQRVIHDVDPSNDEGMGLHLRFKSLAAQIRDSERKFLPAAMKYLEISQLEGLAGKVSEEDLLKSLENASKCGILCESGPGRARVLASIYRDERAPQLPTYRILEKMYKGRLITSQEKDKFASQLKQHQLASLGDGSTVLDRAINEHNMFAASKLYNNIKLSELGKFLGVSAMDAEKIAWRMIEGERLEGNLDQIDEVLEFTQKSEGIFNVWDSQIGEVCTRVNEVLDDISKQHPKYALAD